MPRGAYTKGCGWPVRHTWRLPADLRSGFYRVVSTCPRPGGGRFMQHHFFVVCPTTATQRGKLLMLLPTATWMAYNDWGGANHYQGTDGPDGNLACPRLSAERPWTKGVVWLPEGAPRIMADVPPEPGDAPRYAFKEWAYANGFGLYYAGNGWAQYDRHFVRWAEREGYALDMITQTDLHYRPQILDDYGTVVIVGHDEYLVMGDARGAGGVHRARRQRRPVRRQFPVADFGWKTKAGCRSATSSVPRPKTRCATPPSGAA